MCTGAGLPSLAALLLLTSSLSRASTPPEVPPPVGASPASTDLGVSLAHPIAGDADHIEASELNHHFDALERRDDANIRPAVRRTETAALRAAEWQGGSLRDGRGVGGTRPSDEGSRSGRGEDSGVPQGENINHAGTDLKKDSSKGRTSSGARRELQGGPTDRAEDTSRSHEGGLEAAGSQRDTDASAVYRDSQRDTDASAAYRDSQRDTDASAAYREKRSYDVAYMQSIGHDPLLAWKAKRYDDSYLLSLGYDPAAAWAGKRADDSYLLNVGSDPTMAWGEKRYDDSFLQSVGYDPTMAWGKKRNEDSFLQSVDYDPSLVWSMRHKGNEEYNPDQFYEKHMNKNIESTEVLNENEEEDGKTEIPDTYFLRSDINVEPILTKRSIRPRMFIGVDDYKRSPSEMGPRGFHEGIFNDHFGYFSPVKRSKRNAEDEYALISGTQFPHQIDETVPNDFPIKRKFGMGARGFHGDTFSSGFGDFGTMKKRYHGMTSSGFHGDTFSSGFGDFGTMKKRYNDMTSSGFYGDTFSNGFGDFGTMKKRYSGMTSSGFHGDTFSSGFGDFGTMKKRYHGMTSSGFHGDTFSGGFGDFGTMKKRFPSLNPADYRKAVVNHRLAAMLNGPNFVRGNVAATTNSGRNLPAIEVLPSQINGPTSSSNGGDSR